MHMKSAYVKEQRRYTQKDISEVFHFNAEDTVTFIKKLKTYGVLKMVKATPQEKNLTDLMNEDIEIVNVDINSIDYFYVFDFVGVLTVGNVIIKCYPKYLSKINRPLNEMKQILKVIKKYNSIEQIINLFNGEDELSSFNFLAISLYLINDYNDNGLYANFLDTIEINGEGEILWDKTINETFALICSNQPHYLELQTQNSEDDEMNFFRRLHQCILTECSKKLNDAELIDLFDLDAVSLYEGSLLDFGDTDYILYRLQRELNVQYVTRKQSLLKTMYAYVAHSKTIEQGFGISMYGTNSYNLIWEKVCAEVMGNVLKIKISRLPQPVSKTYISCKNKTLFELIKKPLWKPIVINGKNIEHEADKTLTPDLISIYKIRGGYCFGIFDAKYYNIQLNENEVSSQPGVEDITKQYLYQLAYQDFIVSHGYDYVQNAFLFPDEGQTVKVLGQVEMSILYNLKEEQLVNISAVKLPAEKMYGLYLKNKKLDNLGEMLINLPIVKKDNKTFSSHMIAYLSRIAQNNIKERITVGNTYQDGVMVYPDVLKGEIGAKIIYEILCTNTNKYFYRFSHQEVTAEELVAESTLQNKLLCRELASVSIQFEQLIKNMNDVDKLDMSNLSYELKILFSHGEIINALTSQRLFDDLAKDMLELIKSLYF